MHDNENTPMHEYNVQMLEWHQDALDYQVAIEDAALADAKRKAAWSKVLIKAKRDDPKLPVDILKAMADADADVELLASDAFVKNARAEGLKKKLEWDRAYADNLRTNVVNEREQNKFASEGGQYTGPARPSEPQWGQGAPSKRPPMDDYEPQLPPGERWANSPPPETPRPEAQSAAAAPQEPAAHNPPPTSPEPSQGRTAADDGRGEPTTAPQPGDPEYDYGADEPVATAPRAPKY